MLAVHAEGDLFISGDPHARSFFIVTTLYLLMKLVSIPSMNCRLTLVSLEGNLGWPLQGSVYRDYL